MSNAIQPFLIGLFLPVLLAVAMTSSQWERLQVALFDSYPDLYVGNAPDTLLPARDVDGLAHNAGRDPAAMSRALSHGASMVEFDVLYADGALRVEHSLRYPPIPRLNPGRTLAQAWRELDGRADAFIELKANDRATIEALGRFLEGVNQNSIYVGSRNLRVLSRLVQVHPELKTIYLLRSSDFARFWRAEDTGFLAGVSIGPGLFNEEAVAGLKHRGWLVFAGPVNDVHRVVDLLDWDVDVVNTDDLSILEALRRSRPPFRLGPNGNVGRT
ncbi:MAG: hypothetical protein GEU28_00655 [Dehalococcoidia bacterium]|nr:hypothetical protein [Dehalococcoidia bacterium]